MSLFKIQSGSGRRKEGYRLRDYILLLLALEGKPLTIDEMVNKLGVNKGSLFVTLRRMTKAGTLSASSGQYSCRRREAVPQEELKPASIEVTQGLSLTDQVLGKMKELGSIADAEALSIAMGMENRKKALYPVLRRLTNGGKLQFNEEGGYTYAMPTDKSARLKTLEEENAKLRAEVANLEDANDKAQNEIARLEAEATRLWMKIKELSGKKDTIKEVVRNGAQRETVFC